MIQLVVEGVFIDLYENDAPKLTLSIEDIEDTRATAAYSQNFRVPATENNYQFFQTAFEINGYDFDVTQKRSAQILVDGNQFISGELRLQKIYENKQDNKIDYEVLFLGSVRNFASDVGEATLCNLDFTEFAHELNLANITGSWEAYPESAVDSNNGLFSGSILYPLVDFGNTYAEGTLTSNETAISRGTGKHFTNATYPVEATYFRPCIKVKDVWDKIFQNTNYTYDSAFIDSNLFKHLYVGAWGDEASISLKSLTSAYKTSTQLYNSGLEETVEWEATSNTLEDWDLVNERYVIPEDGLYSINVRLHFKAYFTDLQDPSIHYVTHTINLYKAGTATPIATDTYTITAPSLLSNPYVIASMYLTLSDELLTQGDELYVTIEEDASDYWTGTEIQTDFTEFQIESSPSYNVGSSLSCNTKQIDFIKDIISKFRLVMVPDRNDPNNFIIEPWSNYIGTGDVYDWTHKLSIDKDIQIEPLFTQQKARIEFTDKEGKDYLNKANVDEFDEVYGTLYVDSQNELLNDERKIETKLTPAIVTQIRGAAQTTNGMDNTLVVKVHDLKAEVNDSGTTVALKEPVSPGVRIFWYDGIKTTGTLISYDNTWYITDGVDSDSFTTIPMISQFNEWGDRNDSWTGLDTQTYDLSWQRENTYINYNLANPNLGNSVYDAYWSDYISQIYNKYSRRLTANFILSAEDLINFNFNDVIFVKDTYFYVEKIENVQLGEKQSVKVSLIKLLNYEVPQGGFIPLGDNWEDININWESITDLWETL